MRCGLTWRSGVHGWVRCFHDAGHSGRHEPWPFSNTFITVGYEYNRPMECFWDYSVNV